MPKFENDVEGFGLFGNMKDRAMYTKQQRKMKQQGKEWAKSSGNRRLVGLSMWKNPREHVQLAAQGSRGVNWSQWADCRSLQDPQRAECVRWQATRKATKRLPHNVAQAAAMLEPRPQARSRAQEKPKAYMCTTPQWDGAFKLEPCTHEQHAQQKAGSTTWPPTWAQG